VHFQYLIKVFQEYIKVPVLYDDDSMFVDTHASCNRALMP